MATSLFFGMALGALLAPHPNVPKGMGLIAFGLWLVLLRLPVFRVRKFLEIAVNTMETFSKTFFAKSLLSMSLLKSLNYITLSTCRAADWACLRRTAKNFLVSIFLVKTIVSCQNFLVKTGSFLSKRPLSCQNGTFLSKSATLGMPLTSLGLGVRHGFLSL